MLTRNEAKKTKCPYNMNVNCKAEQCSKWDDFIYQDFIFWCPNTKFKGKVDPLDRKDIDKCREEHNLNDCLDCPEHYGHCR